MQLVFCEFLEGVNALFFVIVASEDRIKLGQSVLILIDCPL